MDDSGDLELLERQASLLQTLLGNLERRRTHRRRTAEPSPPTPGVEPSLDPCDDVSPPRASLRLVEQPQTRPSEPGRKPHFRQKRRWNLSGPAASAQADLDEPQPAAPSATRNMAVRVRGCQVELASAGDSGGVVYAFAVLTWCSPHGLVRKGFHALGGSEREAELACLDGALRYLEQAAPTPSATREILRIQGRQVEILCDTGSDGAWRAFPFLHEDGERHILLRFHVQEALTAPSAAEARRRCIDRLQDHCL